MDQPMRFAVRGTSRDRSWSGIEATLADSFGGFAESTPSASHHVSVHVGKPVVATCRYERILQRRLQVPGDIDVLPAGTRALWHDAGPTSILIIRLNPVLMRAAADAMGVDIERVELRPQLQLHDSRIEHIALAIKAELENEDPFDRLYVEGLGLALATHLLRTYSNREGPTRTERLTAQRLRRVTEYIREHLADDLGLAEIAAFAGVSPSYFKALFKRATGVPIHQYVIRCRVEYAIEQLLTHDIALSELAQNAGFANQSHMAKCMKRVAGFTPGSIR